MTKSQNLLLSIFSALFIISQCVSLSISPQPYKALVAPITKDSQTSLFSVTLNFQEKYVIDLGGPFVWYHCPKHYSTISCLAPKCFKAQYYYSPVLCPLFKRTSKPPCNCVVTPSNPITKMCALAELTQKDLSAAWTDGRSQKKNINFRHVYVSCAPKSLLTSLPEGTSGMAGLSRSPLALPLQFTPQYLKVVKQQFSLCLPSVSGAAPGAVLFGEGPFYMTPSSNLDITTTLSYTPLRKHPTSPDYFIDVKAVSINRIRCHFLARVLEFDSLGHGGVKLSTLVPYTILRSHVYRSFIKEFAKATRGIPRANKVKPFELCLNISTLSSTRVGLSVPQIDIELVNGKNWTMFGSNSMKQVSQDVACLAVFNGGERTQEAAVIGSYQMEDRFLLFDLKESKLGFSSPLSLFSTSCSNFNFTSKG